MKVKRISKRIAAILVLAMVFCMVAAIGVFADTGSIQTAVTGALETTQADAMSMIAAVLPYALAILGAFIVITIGIRAFKKVSGR